MPIPGYAAVWSLIVNLVVSIVVSVLVRVIGLQRARRPHASGRLSRRRRRLIAGVATPAWPVERQDATPATKVAGVLRLRRP